MVQSQQSLGKSPTGEPAQRARMNLELRKFQATEYERFAHIRTSVFPDHPMSAQELKSFDDNLDKTKYYLQRYSCFNKDTGELVGLGDIGHMPWMFNPQRFQGRIIVDKDYQNKGVGQYLYENLIQFLSDFNASEAWAFGKEDMPVSLSFLAKRGFRERFRSWESWLNPATVNVPQYSHYSDKASTAGVDISTLAQELSDDPECYRKLYTLNQDLMADVPLPEPFTPLPYEQWLAFDMNDPGLIPEAYAIAKHGTEYVGLSTVRHLDKEPRGLYQALTGVRREYRGKGVALAMKLKVIEYARKNGYEKIKTENATTNAAMFGINMKLGFKRETGWIAFSKKLP
jgi:GNAT superfamily N-acetyltransferase